MKSEAQRCCVNLKSIYHSGHHFDVSILIFWWGASWKLAVTNPCLGR